MTNVVDLELHRKVRDAIRNDPNFRAWVSSFLKEYNRGQNCGTVPAYNLRKITFNGMEIPATPTPKADF